MRPLMWVAAGAVGLMALGGGLSGPGSGGLPSPERITANAAAGYGAAKCISNARMCLKGPGGSGGGGSSKGSKESTPTTTAAPPPTAPPTTAPPPASPLRPNDPYRIRSTVPRAGDRPMPRMGVPPQADPLGQLAPVPQPLPQLAG